MDKNKPLTFLGVEVPEVLLPGGIEAQESAGQVMTNLQQTLPIDLNGTCTRADLESLGFVFGEPQDELFVYCQFPAGWRKQASEASRHSYLLDDKGRKRGSIFYKAAFYDRRADMALLRRYAVTLFNACDERGNAVDESQSPATHAHTLITDDGAPLHEIGIRARRDWDTAHAHEKDGQAWLEEHFPDWRNPLAYWE